MRTVIYAVEWPTWMTRSFGQPGYVLALRASIVEMWSDVQPPAVYARCADGTVWRITKWWRIFRAVKQ